MPSPSVRELHCIGIVNRGEAALRCIRTVKSMRARDGLDLRCLALYTDVDRNAPFVRQADEALRLVPPGATAVSAYLDADGLLDALRRGGADTVWPGWGFVAEDAVFADRVARAGLVFLGPSGAVMRALGDKIGAKRVAEQAGVPVLPWSGGELPDVESRARARGARRLPARAQGERGRRRARDPRRRARGGSRGGVHQRERGGARRVRRRPPVPRGAAASRATHRGADRRGRARHGVGARLPRLLGAAPPPEDHRGGAAAGSRSRLAARADGRRGAARAARRLCRRRARSSSWSAKARPRSSR